MKLWICPTCIEVTAVEGDKGDKGVILYESVFCGINTILATIPPCTPHTPLNVQNEKVSAGEPTE